MQLTCCLVVRHEKSKNQNSYISLKALLDAELNLPNSLSCILSKIKPKITKRRKRIIYSSFNKIKLF